MPNPDVVGVFHEGGQQRFVREDVDAAHQSVGRIGDELDGVRRKNVRPAVAGRAHPEHQVAFEGIARQRLHVEMVDDAVLELAHVRLIQLGVQFRLPEQDDLQQLVIADLQVVEQAQLFQRIQRHGVRLIDQYDDTLAFAGLLLELVLDAVHDDADALAVDAQAERVGNRIQHFFARQARVGEINGFNMFGQPLEQHAAQHGFAAADFAADFDDAFCFA